MAGTAERSRAEGAGKINSAFITGCDFPVSMIHTLSGIPWTGAAQRPSPWPAGFSLMSRRLSDITAIYEEAAFGLVGSSGTLAPGSPVR